jgi:hypothetical protein
MSRRKKARKTAKKRRAAHEEKPVRDALGGGKAEMKTNGMAQ